MYFHFDKEDENIRITSERGKAARVTITPRVSDNISIRIPRWTPAESIHITVNGNPFSPIILGDFAHVPGNTSPHEIVLVHELPDRKSVEKTERIEFEFTWRGDEITGVCPNSDLFPFYPTAKGCTDV